MKILKSLFLFTLISSLLVACGSSGPSVKKDLQKLNSYDSYAYLPNRDTILDRDLNNLEIQQIIINTINSNMQEKGFSLDKIQPDVLVHVHPMFDDKVAVNANPVYTNYAYYRPGFYIGPYYRDYMYDNYFTVQRINGPRVNQIPYKTGSIVIDLIDRKTNEILWRGTSDKKIERKRMSREIREYIDEVFKKL